MSRCLRAEKWAEPVKKTIHNSLPERGILTSYRCSHYQRRILTAGRCSHYQSGAFSLPAAVLTTRARNSHYRLLFSLPEWGILTTGPCSHYQSGEFSLPAAVLYQSREFSLLVAVLTTSARNSHYRSLFSLPEWEILATSPCSHYQTGNFH